MAPIQGCKLSAPVLRDAARLSQRSPPIARYGIFCVSTWPIGCDTPSPFSEGFPLGEHAKWRCDTSPHKGYLSDTCAIPHENKANGCDTPSAVLSRKRYYAICGGYSHWAAKSIQDVFPLETSRIRFRRARLQSGTDRPSCRSPSCARYRQDKQYTIVKVLPS